MTGHLELPDGSLHPVRDDLVIGRDAGCDLPLAATGVSRHHAKLVVQHGVVEIVDLDSRNGVSLNGHAVQRRVLRDGDELQLGRARLVYRLHAPVAGGADDMVGEAPGVRAGADLLAGEDLLGGADLLAGEDLLGESDAPRPTLSPPRPTPAPAPAPDPSPSSREVPESPADDVIEFVDEIVAVREPKPGRETTAGRPAAGAERALPDASRGVLQFQNQSKKRGGLLGDDLAQTGGAGRLIQVLIALVVAGALGYGAFVLAG